MLYSFNLAAKFCENELFVQNAMAMIFVIQQTHPEIHWFCRSLVLVRHADPFVTLQSVIYAAIKCIEPYTDGTATAI